MTCRLHCTCNVYVQYMYVCVQGRLFEVDGILCNIQLVSSLLVNIVLIFLYTPVHSCPSVVIPVRSLSLTCTVNLLTDTSSYTTLQIRCLHGFVIAVLSTTCC